MLATFRTHPSFFLGKSRPPSLLPFWRRLRPLNVISKPPRGGRSRKSGCDDRSERSGERRRPVFFKNRSVLRLHLLGFSPDKARRTSSEKRDHLQSRWQQSKSPFLQTRDKRKTEITRGRV